MNLTFLFGGIKANLHIIKYCDFIMQNALEHIRVVLPETRQLDVLSGMLEKHQATVIRCPLVSILDNPDTGPIGLWLEKFIISKPDLFIIMTGEGLRRLAAFADRLNVGDAFISALYNTKKLVRGPKPVSALREIGLDADIRAVAPTTDGIIETLAEMEILNHNIGVQLYGLDPNERLMNYLNSRQAIPHTVSPYIYASEADDAQVLQLIHDLHDGLVDVLAFTSASQYRRLHNVARNNGLKEQMISDLNEIKVAAVGPVMAKKLEDSGIQVHIQPKEKFFMRPLVNRIVESFNT